eukprot:Nk52_evm3s683 gene=Nk52_evmTU3s683
MAYRVTRSQNPLLKQQQQAQNENNENSLPFQKRGGVVEKRDKRSALGDIGNKVNKADFAAREGGIKKMTKKASQAFGRAKVFGKRKEKAAQPAPQEIPAKEEVVEEAPQSMDIDSSEPAKEEMIEEKVDPCHTRDSRISDICDIDKEDGDNTVLVAEYVNDVYKYLFEAEKSFLFNPEYMSTQEDINAKMRAILIDWLVEVHLKFKLLHESLYLTINIIDRYLEKILISRDRLQLVGVTAMLIACKYEEIYTPEVGDFVYITDNAYDKYEILEMERTMLRTLGFDLGVPLPLHFLRRFSKAARADANTHTMAKYLMELSVVDYSMCKYSYSMIAASALYCSQILLDFGTWNSTVAFYSTYEFEQMEECIKGIISVIHASIPHKLQAVRSKYSSSKFFRIAEVCENNLSKLDHLR